MNKHEIQTIRQESQRFMKDIKLTEVEGSVRLDLSFSDPQSNTLYLFVAKRKGNRSFSLLIPVQSTGILTVQSTLAMLQPLLKTYGLIISQDAVIMEENTKLSLNKRIRNMTQALIALDGIKRLWKVEFNRRQNASESQVVEPTSNSADPSTCG